MTAPKLTRTESKVERLRRELAEAEEQAFEERRYKASEQAAKRDRLKARLEKLAESKQDLYRREDDLLDQINALDEALAEFEDNPNDDETSVPLFDLDEDDQ